MIKSIYTPLSGAVTQERVLEIVANNLANMNTNGFKGDKVSFELLRAEPEKYYNNPLPPANYKVGYEQLNPLVGNEVEYVGLAEVQRDTTQGPMSRTNNQTDMMIEGDGFFTVQTRDGMRLSRNGAFAVNQEGILTTKTGDPVLGMKGTIQLAAGEFQVNRNGEVYQDGEMIDRFMIQKVKQPETLERIGHNYYLFEGRQEDIETMEFPVVTQGSLEGSNVNAIQNLTAMILAHRSVEAYNKAIANFDSMMEKSSNRIGDARA